MTPHAARHVLPATWAKVIDHTRCIGCHACSTACKSENDVPLSVNRTYVKAVDVGTFPNVRRAFQVTRCNQCDNPPCVTVCPTAAMYRREDGIVDFDKRICIGCKACIAACPYDAIFINPDDHSAEKCNLCPHRLDMGLEPACVVVCPTEAIVVGDINDPSSAVANYVSRDVVSVRRPEKETRPKLFYKGAHQTTLDPVAARRPGGGIFMWSQQLRTGQSVVSGHPDLANASAAAVLAYDIPHTVPWDWRVSLYTWTKGIAAGVYLIALLLIALGAMGGGSALWRWVVPVLGGTFLAATGALLIWDLEHPERFYLLFTRPQRASWLVRGGYIILGYSAVLAAHVAATLSSAAAFRSWLAVAGLPLATLTAVYTAYLFAQAKGRDLWQNPLLPAHFVVQAMLAGSAALLPFADWLEPGATPLLRWSLAASAALLLLLVAGESTLTHATAHAHLAARERIGGRYRAFFWTGIVLMLGAVAAPWIGAAAVPLALGGLVAHEHAHVQAAQSVPLA